MPEIDPKSFGTFEKRMPCPQHLEVSVTKYFRQHKRFRIVFSCPNNTLSFENEYHILRFRLFSTLKGRKWRRLMRNSPFQPSTHGTHESVSVVTIRFQIAFQSDAVSQVSNGRFFNLGF